MIESHMATLASLRLARFICGKCVASMAGIAGCRSEFGALAAQINNFRFCLEPNLMTSATTLLALYHCHRLPMDCRHRLHSSPCHRVLALFELINLGLVARCTGFGGGQLHPRYI